MGAGHSAGSGGKRPPRTAWMDCSLPCSGDAGGGWAGGIRPVGSWSCGEQPKSGRRFLPGPTHAGLGLQGLPSTSDSNGWAIAAEGCSGLGTAGARLDDLLTWLPCRFVALSLPLVTAGACRRGDRWDVRFGKGRSDPSPMPAFPGRPMPGGPRSARRGQITNRGRTSPQASCLASDSRGGDQARVERMPVV